MWVAFQTGLLTFASKAGRPYVFVYASIWAFGRMVLKNMRSVYHRLHHTKLILSCVLMVVIGGVLIAVGAQDTNGWVGVIPWSEFGSVLVGAGLLSIGLDQYLKREQEAIDEQRLRRMLSEQAPALRDAVLEAFAANHSDLERIATPEMLDNLISNSLALRLKDAQFASEVYADIRDQAVGATERWYDTSLNIRLEPLPMGRGNTEGVTSTSVSGMFSVTVRWEYTTTPVHARRHFTCLSDRDEYVELANQRDTVSAWYINPDSGIDPTSSDSFELLHFAIDGEERPIRRSTRKSAQTYAVSIGEEHLKAEKPVTVTYTYRAIMQRTGNLLFFDIEQPTRDLTVTFDYRNCGIATVTTLDMIPSVRPTRIETPNETKTADTVNVAIDGWIFPRSGVAFVWTLEGREKRLRSGGSGVRKVRS